MNKEIFEELKETISGMKQEAEDQARVFSDKELRAYADGMYNAYSIVSILLEMAIDSIK